MNQDNQFQQAVTYIRSNLSAGFPPDQLERQLIQSGWDPAMVARVMQQAQQAPQSLQPAQRMPSVSLGGGLAKKPIVFVALVFAAIAAAIALFVLTSPKSTNEQPNAAESSAEGQGQSEDQQGALYTSDDANLSFRYPDAWQVEDLSSDGSDSFYWQLQKPGGDEISKQLEEKYSIEWEPSSLSIGGEAPAPEFTEAFQDPLVRQLATVDIKLFKSPGFTIESDLAEWKQAIDVSNGLAEGLFRADSFQNITVSGSDGLKYNVSANIGDAMLSSVEYVVIFPDQRLEVSVFPGSTDDSGIIDAIVDSVVTL